jgi:hypothetical protein
VKCARCDFRTPDQDDAAAHALEAGHPLCPVCHHSLTDTDPAFACEKCLTRARTDLAGIMLMYDELPRHLGHPKVTVYDQSPHGTDGPPLPGGDALVLLGPGSQGLSDDAETAIDGDPASVAFELDWWERDWREARGDAIDPVPMTTRAVVQHAAAYLEVHGRWAANNHPGFDVFAADLKRLHSLLERATARADVHEVAEAECMSCGGELVREVRPRKADDKPRRIGTEDEGYQRGFTCQQCGRVYQVPDEGFNEYAFALSAHLRNNPQEWAPAEMLTEWFGVSPALLRQWKHRGQITARTTTYDVTLYRVCCPVDWSEAASA